MKAIFDNTGISKELQSYIKNDISFTTEFAQTTSFNLVLKNGVALIAHQVVLETGQCNVNVFAFGTNEMDSHDYQKSFSENNVNDANVILKQHIEELLNIYG